MQLVVGRIGRPHGIRGEVTVQVRTDDPGRRFAAGTVLATEPAALGPLTVMSSRWHSGRLLVSFAGPTGVTQRASPAPCSSLTQPRWGRRKIPTSSTIMI